VHVPRRAAFETLSMSALDLFASALGVFVLISILMFPYYLKMPSIEAGLAGAKDELAATTAAGAAAAQRLAAAEQAKAAAEADLQAARARLQRAQAAAAAQPPPQPREAPRKNLAPLTIQDLDLVFVMDTTGSMGRELADLQANLIAIVNILHRMAESLRVGFVAYKDEGDVYLTRDFQLRAMTGQDVAAMVGFVRSLEASGGGDVPEPVDAALQVALAMPWRADGQGRIIVIGDAPARNRDQTLALARRFAGTGMPEAPRSLSAIVTGPDPAIARFFQQVAGAGGGEFSISQGNMVESVLLSILPRQDAAAAGGGSGP
jgi:hypothetical protein